MTKFAKIIHKNKENFLIKKFIGLFKRKIKSKGKNRFSFVLTGGKSPIKLYRHLAKDKSISWRKIDFFINRHKDKLRLKDAGLHYLALPKIP